jgi:hypothetical protein
MRRCDYYIIAFQSHGKTYYFKDMSNEGIVRAALGFGSSYFDLRGLENATIIYREFKFEVIRLTGLIYKDPYNDCD